MKASAILAASAAIIASAALNSCGKIITVKSKDENVERKLVVSGNFSAIESNDITDVTYTDGPLAITLSAPEELIDKIDVKVKNGVLTIDMRDSEKVKGNYHTHLSVSAPGVTRFYSNGIGDFDILKVSGDDILFESNGIGDFEANSLECSSLTVTSNGIGDAEIKSITAAKVNLSSYGTGDIKIDRIKTGTMTVMTCGTGDIRITAGNVENAELTNSSTGDIDLIDVTVGKVNQSNSGTGDINISKR